jgi:hypothetical protein
MVLCHNSRNTLYFVDLNIHSLWRKMRNLARFFSGFPLIHLLSTLNACLEVLFFFNPSHSPHPQKIKDSSICCSQKVVLLIWGCILCSIWNRLEHSVSLECNIQKTNISMSVNYFKGSEQKKQSCISLVDIFPAT